MYKQKILLAISGFSDKHPPASCVCHIIFQLQKTAYLILNICYIGMFGTLMNDSDTLLKC